MLNVRKAVVIVLVLVGAWLLLPGGGPGSGDGGEAGAGTQTRCGDNIKDTLGGLLDDPKTCIEDWLENPVAGAGSYARAYFTYDQSSWQVAAEPYHDPLVTDYGVNAVSNGETQTVAVEIYREDGELSWSGTASHGEVALLVVDFVDLPGADRVVVTGQDGQSTEAVL